MTDLDALVGGHYGWPGLMDAIENELRQHGIDPEHVTVDQLAPVDNYHAFRLAGTIALARAAGISGIDHVLDVGGGIGGPARQLAVALRVPSRRPGRDGRVLLGRESLTAWTHLTDQVSFVHASALDMPFEAASFDVVWTQHASMNIADKAALYGEIARVVRPGGRFAFFDILAGPNQPIHFPCRGQAIRHSAFCCLPTRRGHSSSDAGFRETTWLIGGDLRAELDRAERDEADHVESPLDAGLLNGPDSARMAERVARNLKEGRILPVIGVFERH